MHNRQTTSALLQDSRRSWDIPMSNEPPSPFLEESFVACDGVRAENFGSDWRWKIPAIDPSTDRELDRNHVILLTSGKKIQNLLVRVGCRRRDGVKHRDEAFQQLCIFGQLDHGKPINRFAVGRLGKGKQISEERRRCGQYRLMDTEVDEVGRSNDKICVRYVQTM